MSAGSLELRHLLGGEKRAYDGKTLLSDLLSAGTAGVAGAARHLTTVDQRKAQATSDMHRDKSRAAWGEARAALDTAAHIPPKNESLDLLIDHAMGLSHTPNLEQRAMLRRYALEMRDEARAHAASSTAALSNKPDRTLEQAGAVASNATAELLGPVGSHHLATPLASMIGQLAATGLLSKLAPNAGLAAHGAASAGGALAARLGLRGYDALTGNNDPVDTFGKTSADEEPSLADSIKRRVAGAIAGATFSPLVHGDTDFGDIALSAVLGAPVGAYAAGAGILPGVGALGGFLGAAALTDKLRIFGAPSRTQVARIAVPVGSILSSGIGAGLGEYAEDHLKPYLQRGKAYVGDRIDELRDRFL